MYREDNSAQTPSVFKIAKDDFSKKNSGILFCSIHRLKFVGPLAPAPSPAAVPAACGTVTQAVELPVSSSCPSTRRSLSSDPMFLGARLMSSFPVVVILCI